jgi:chromate reductase, NAD(P)H dehydrogenase (quinone)
MGTATQERISFKLQEPVRFLVFSASLRPASLNTRLATLVTHTIEQHEGNVDLADMAQFDAPSYDQDLQDQEGFPAEAEAFYQRIIACDAFVICSPEYNASMPGLLKNAIDWVSRFQPQPFNERHGLLLSASPSLSGGNRGLWSLRIPLEHLGARIFPDMFSLAQAHKAFNAEGEIADEKLGLRFRLTIQSFMELAEASKKYPCAKKAWFEYLGEQVEGVTARAE